GPRRVAGHRPPLPLRRLHGPAAPGHRKPMTWGSVRLLVRTRFTCPPIAHIGTEDEPAVTLGRAASRRWGWVAVAGALGSGPWLQGLPGVALARPPWWPRPGCVPPRRGPASAPPGRSAQRCGPVPRPP